MRLMLMDSLKVGDVVSGYRIEDRVATGGMGVLYAATEVSLGRSVALKVINDDAARDETFRRRFVHEARQASSIDHPNVVPIYGFGEVDDRLYLAMRLIDGPDLAHHLEQRRTLPPQLFAITLRQIASALDALHVKGLVHRDVKPANILLSGLDTSLPHAYLTDFGIARSAAETRLTAAGQMLGTVVYASPEQLQSADSVDRRSDVYSLACVAFECLTGEPPFPGETVVTVLLGHLHAPVPAATGRQAALPPAVDAVLARGLAKDPDDRWDSCGAFAEALIAAAESDGARSGPVALPTSSVPQDVPPTPRTPPIPPTAASFAVVGPASTGSSSSSATVSVDGGPPLRRARLALAVCVVLLVCATAFVLTNTGDDPATVSSPRTADPAASAQTIVALADQLTTVRRAVAEEVVVVAASDQADTDVPSAGSTAAAERTDEAVGSLDAMVDQLDGAALPTPLVGALEDARFRLAALPELRRSGASDGYPFAELIDGYQATLESTTSVVTEMQFAAEGLALAGSLRTLATLTDADDAAAITMAVVAAASARGEQGWRMADGARCQASGGCDESARVVELMDDEMQALQEFDDIAAPDDRAARRAQASTAEQVRSLEIRDSAVALWDAGGEPFSGAAPLGLATDEIVANFVRVLDQRSTLEEELVAALG